MPPSAALRVKRCRIELETFFHLVPRRCTHPRTWLTAALGLSCMGPLWVSHRAFGRFGTQSSEVNRLFVWTTKHQMDYEHCECHFLDDYSTGRPFGRPEISNSTSEPCQTVADQIRPPDQMTHLFGFLGPWIFLAHWLFLGQCVPGTLDIPCAGDYSCDTAHSWDTGYCYDTGYSWDTG